jgi:hypothetical protein
MSAIILAAISHLPQLRGSLRHTAQRLAYFAGINGRVQKSYSFLAEDLHVSESTTMRHIAKLCAKHIIEKEVRWLASKQCAINVYTFLIGVPLGLHKCDPSRLPEEQAQQEKKNLRVRVKDVSAKGANWLRTVDLNPVGDFLRWCGG